MTDLERPLPKLGDDLEVWDMLPEESTAAYAAFAQYRDLGPKRTRAATAKALGCSSDSLREWAARNAWEDRCRAYDLELDRRGRAQLEAGRTAARKRHAGLAEFVQKKVAERLAMLDPAELSPKDLVYYLDVAVKLERQALALADKSATVEVTGANGGPIQIAENLDSAGRAALMAEVAAELSRRMGPADVPAVEAIWDAEVVDEGA